MITLEKQRIRKIKEGTGITLTTVNGVLSINFTGSDGIDLSTHAVTELSDVAGAGSGNIITNAERTKLAALYTKAQEDAWRSNVDATEMSYLHGVTSGIQDQLDALVDYGVDNQIPFTNAGGDGFDYSANLVFTATGLGIGTASPKLKGHIVDTTSSFPATTGTTQTGGVLRIQNSDSNAILDMGGNGGSGFWLQTTLATDLNTNYPLLLNPNGGSVGIGTTSPAGKLQVVTSDTNGGGIGATWDSDWFVVGQTGGSGSGVGIGYDSTNNVGTITPATPGTAYRDLALCPISGNVGIGEISPSYQLDVNGTGRFTGNLYGDANVQNLSFASGFQGDKWQITEDGNSEWEDVFIRGGLTVWELIINQLHYQCGGLIIGAGGGKVSEVVDATVNAEQLFFEDPEGNNIVPFTVGAIIMVQDVDLNRTTVVKRYARQVSALTDVDGKWRIDLTTTANAPANVGTFAKGDEVVAIGHVSNTALDSFIYMSAVDSNNPFFRVMDGVDDYAKFSLGSDTGLRLQMGNLNGTYGYAAEIYGFAAGDPNNEYMTVDPTNGIRFFNDAGTKVAELAGSSFLVGGSGSNRIEFDGTTFTIVATTYDLSASNLSITSATGIEIGSDFWKNNKTFQFGGGILDGDDTAVNLGGWTADADSLYSGTKYSGTDYASDAGFTLNSNGTMHTKYFYVDSDGYVGLAGTEITHLIRKQGSQVIRNSHDVTASTASVPYVKLKTFTFTNGLTGVIRASFRLVSTVATKWVNARVYKNGIALGTQFAMNSTTPIDCSEELPETTWLPGETIELWGRAPAGDCTCATEEFRLKYDDDPIMVVETTNS